MHTESGMESKTKTPLPALVSIEKVFEEIFTKTAPGLTFGTSK
jgi:hypothetical protein